MKKEDIIEGVKRPLSYGIISSPAIKQPERDEIARDTAAYLAKGNNIEYLPNTLDEFSPSSMARESYG